MIATVETTLSGILRLKLVYRVKTTLGPLYINAFGLSGALNLQLQPVKSKHNRVNVNNLLVIQTVKFRLL